MRCARASVRACVRACGACVRACVRVRACVCACVRAYVTYYDTHDRSGDDGPPPIPPGYVELEDEAAFTEFLLWTMIDDDVDGSWYHFHVINVSAHTRTTHTHASTHACMHAPARTRARTHTHLCPNSGAEAVSQGQGSVHSQRAHTRHCSHTKAWSAARILDTHWAQRFSTHF